MFTDTWLSLHNEPAYAGVERPCSLIQNTFSGCPCLRAGGHVYPDRKCQCKEVRTLFQIHDHCMTFNSLNGIRKDILGFCTVSYTRTFHRCLWKQKNSHLTKEKFMIPDTMIFIVLCLCPSTLAKWVSLNYLAEVSVGNPAAAWMAFQ